MPRSETPLFEATGRIIALLQLAEKPWTFNKLKDALNKGSKNVARLGDVELKSALEAAINQSAVFRWPDRRGSQYFSCQSPDQAAQQAVLALASEEALPKSELLPRACRKVQGFSQTAMQRVVESLLRGRELQQVAAFTSGKLLMRSGSRIGYATAARKFISEKLRKTGFDPAEFLLPASSQDAPRAPAIPVSASAQILEAIRAIEPNVGVPVTTQKLRSHLRVLSKGEFDTAALRLRDSEQVFVSLHHDPHNLPRHERDLLIDGGDGTFYVDIAIRR